jgi:hypothetical protein
VIEEAFLQEGKILMRPSLWNNADREAGLLERTSSSWLDFVGPRRGEGEPHASESR